jgi:hypothetical protein
MQDNHTKRRRMRRSSETDFAIAYTGMTLVIVSVSICGFFISYGIDVSRGFSWGITCLGLAGLGLCVFGLVRAESLDRAQTDAEAKERAWMSGVQKEGDKDEAL